MDRNERREKGLCIECGALAGGYQRCESCRRKNTESQKRRAQRNRLARTCRMCGQRPEAHAGLCEACWPKQQQSSKEWRAEQRQKGCCTACGKGLDREGVRCKECQVKNLEAIQARRKRLLGEGKCRDCGKEAQLIDRTGQHHMPGGLRKSNYCRECFFKMTAGYVLGSRKRWRELVELLEANDWRCVYTGEKLVLGENLSFDHVQPVCRCPERKTDISNIEPVTLTVNLMKRHLTREEFLTLVNQIAKRWPDN